MTSPHLSRWAAPPLAPLLRPVHLLGYWVSDSEPWWPGPQAFVDADWEPRERQVVIAHLEAGTELSRENGLSWCRFRCGEVAMGFRELTDGVFYWPEGLAHYVRYHHLRPPTFFTDHVLRRPLLRYWIRRWGYAALGRWAGLTSFRSDAWWRSFPSGTRSASGSIEDGPPG